MWYVKVQHFLLLSFCSAVWGIQGMGVRGVGIGIGQGIGIGIGIGGRPLEGRCPVGFLFFAFDQCHLNHNQGHACQSYNRILAPHGLEIERGTDP